MSLKKKHQTKDMKKKSSRHSQDLIISDEAFGGAKQYTFRSTGACEPFDGHSDQ